jgi:phosphopantothenoylcysteine decarboxylase/phosphopantothenate--cysteine ligase
LPQPAGPRLDGYEVLVCVSGGIAAYKTATLVSGLVQAGCGVTVAMTDAATRFVGAVTFQALTGRRVYTSLWPDESAGEIQHLKLSETADLVVVAPATADVIGMLAGGLADDLVSSRARSCSRRR